MTTDTITHTAQIGGVGGCFLAQLYYASGKPLATISATEDPAEATERARRLAACWNALADLPQAALDGGWTRAGLEAYCVKVERQRDALQAAAQKALDGCCDLIATPEGDALHAAIAICMPSVERKKADDTEGGAL